MEVELLAGGDVLEGAGSALEPMRLVSRVCHVGLSFGKKRNKAAQYNKRKKRRRRKKYIIIINK